MSSLSKDVAMLAVIAAAYTVLVFILAPISFYAIQVRVADALLALSVIIGPPAILGTTLGCFIANLLGPFGIVDAVGGSIANLVATTLAWKLRKRPLLALAQMPVVVSLIVSAYLYQLFYQSSSDPLFTFSITFSYLLIGSVISIDLIGYTLLKAVERLYKS